MGASDKDLVWLHGEVKTPPFTREARLEVGFLLRHLQQGGSLRMPKSRPMPNIGANCYELRVPNVDKNWRIIYRIDHDAVVIIEVFNKTTQETPQSVIRTCQKRLGDYDAV
jgi:phage-related protein